MGTSKGGRGCCIVYESKGQYRPSLTEIGDRGASFFLNFSQLIPTTFEKKKLHEGDLDSNGGSLDLKRNNLR